MSLRRAWSPAAWGRRLPSDDADELTWLLFHQEDVLSLEQARRHLSPKAIRHRAATGTWRQIHRAVFVAHNGPVSAGQLRWAAVLAAGPQAILGGLTAAQAGGLRGFPGRPIHILLPASCRRGSLPAGVLAHRTVTLRDQDVLAVGQPKRTMPARSIVDAAQWASDDQQARTIIAAACQQQGIVAGDDLSRIVERLPRVRRRQLMLATAADAAGGAHSLAELDFLGLIRRAGLPEPARQKIRYDSTGRRRYLDAYFEEWRVHIEIDGGQHIDPRAWWADMRRQNDLWIEGDRVLRFPAWVIRAHPDEVLRQILEALRAAGWKG